MAAVGLALGAGMYLAAGIAEIIALLTLIILGHIEKRIFPAERNKLLELSYGNGGPHTKETLKVLESFGIRLESMDVLQDAGKKKATKLRLLVGIPIVTDIPKLAKALKTAGKVDRIEMKERY
jgi:putative Mg2+ transporter-C (MgtC) family protein